MQGRKAQAGVEYIAIISIALLVLISGAVIFFDYSRASNSQVVASQLNIIGQTIMSNAEAMYVLGNESWITIEFSLPGSVTEAAISGGSEMYFTYDGPGGESQAVFFSQRFGISNSNTPCTATCYLNFTPGLNRVRIKSGGNFVSIRRTN
jgi:hypothetical protein